MPPAVPCVWDRTHLLDLGDGEARRAPGCSWVNRTVDDISRITKRFAVGKSRELLRKTSEEQNLPLRGLQLWSETSLVPHTATVLTNFSESMHTYAAAMKQLMEAPSTKDSVKDKLQADLHLLTGALSFAVLFCTMS